MMPNLRNRFVLAGLLTAAALTSNVSAQVVKTLRWAVIGGSVANAGYPARIAFRVPADSVISYAYSGGTVLKSGDSSYWTSGKLAQVFAYNPDIVSIQLGTDDSKPRNWVDSANFERDYKALIDTLSGMPSHPRIIVVYPTPVWKDETAPQSPDLKRGSVIGGSILEKVRKVAKDKSADTVDLYTPMLARQSLFTDSINPANTAAHDTLGRRIFFGMVDQSTRIVCVGNSITYANGTTTGVTTKDAYPYRLNMLLGPRFYVWNGGKSGWWMQRAALPGGSAYKSYVTDKAQMDTVFSMRPHYITVKLGTNDSRKNFWIGSRFLIDYRYFIDTIYNNMPVKPKIFLFKAFPAWKVNGNWAFSNSGYTADTNGINGDIIRDSLFPAIDVIAASRPTSVAGVIDLWTPFNTPTQTLSTDGVHPNKAGQDSIAHVVYHALLPVVTGIRPAISAKGATAGPSRAVRVLRTESGIAHDAGLKTVDGKAAGRGGVAAGVYIKPSPASNKPDNR